MNSEITATNNLNINGEIILKENQNTKQFVTMQVDGQLFGIPVLAVQDVLRPQRVTKTPLAPVHIKGSINLRGRIVTVIGMRSRLSLSEREGGEKHMQVVIEHNGDLYSLMVDSVGEVLNLSLSDFEKSPANLDSKWQEISVGVYRLKDKIMIVLDLENLLNF